MAEIEKIKIKINDNLNIEIDYNDARSLYDALNKMFGTPTYPIYEPYRTYPAYEPYHYEYPWMTSAGLKIA